jgi:hypothetical protein
MILGSTGIARVVRSRQLAAIRGNSRQRRTPVACGANRTLTERRSQNLIYEHSLEHDPEKWIPVFGKDHAPAIS